MNMKALFVFLILLVLQTLSQAEVLTIVDVKRNITLSDDEPVYKDYYIHSSETSSLKKNLVVLVKRKLTVKDVSSKTIGDFETKVGQLKIIHVEGKVAVGREYKLIPRDDEPMLEQIGIMPGDRLDLTDSFIDNTKPIHKQKTADLEQIINDTAANPIDSDPESVKIPINPVTPTPMPTDRLPATKEALVKSPTPEI